MNMRTRDVQLEAVDDDPTDFGHFARAIGRHKLLFAFVFLLVQCLAVSYYRLASPWYSADAEVFYEAPRRSLLQERSTIDGPATVDTFAVDTQVQLLRSENVLRKVVRDLNLAHDPDFNKVGLLGSVLVALHLHPPAPEDPDPATLERATLIQLERLIDIQRVDLTYVIRVSARARTPELAARIANGVVEAYIADEYEGRVSASQRAQAWLEERVKILRERQLTSERAVEEFKRDNKLISAGGRLVTEQQLMELNTRVADARAQVAQAQARVTQIKEVIASGAVDSPTSDAVQDSVLQRLRVQLSDASRVEANLVTRFGETHPAVVNARAELAEIRKQIADQLQLSANNMENDLEIAKRRVQGLENSLNDAIQTSEQSSKAQIGLRDLEREAEANRNLYERFLQVYTMAAEQQSYPSSDVRIVTRAYPATAPSSPKPLFIFAGGAALGLLAAFLAAVMRDISRNRQRLGPAGFGRRDEKLANVGMH